jgi:hypothetical protein
VILDHFGVRRRSLWEVQWHYRAGPPSKLCLWSIRVATASNDRRICLTSGERSLAAILAMKEE